MPSRWTETVHYTEGPDGHPRPYLWLALRGPHGGPALHINGLIDSGADKSVLPSDYAQLLGYEDEDLEPTEVGQVKGTIPGLDAQVPCKARVPGVKGVSFEIRPLFVETLDPLWGRADFMAAFTVSISESRQELTLRLPKG